MSDTGLARTNYFRVKDSAAFDAFIAACRHPVNVVNSATIEGAVAIWSDEDWPPYKKTGPGVDDEVEIDFLDELTPHLADGEVCVAMSAGHDKARYCFGVATAFDNTGKTIHLSLDQIYEIAQKEFGTKPNPAQY